MQPYDALEGGIALRRVLTDSLHHFLESVGAGEYGCENFFLVLHLLVVYYSPV